MTQPFLVAVRCLAYSELMNTKRLVIAVLLCAVCVAGWPQTYLEDWDGRNWRMMSGNEKQIFIQGFLTCSIAICDLANFAVKGGQMHSHLWAAIVKIFPRGTVAERVERIDQFYDTEGVVTTPIWKAFFESWSDEAIWWEGAHPLPPRYLDEFELPNESDE